MMDLNATLNQAQFFLERNRLNEAESLLRGYLAQEPEEAMILNLLAYVYYKSDKLAEAEEVIQSAIGIEPDNDRFLYTYSFILIGKNDYKKAEEYIRQAIQFNPEEAEYFGLLSNIKLNQKNFTDALKYADQGLAIDPSSIFCLNMKSTAMVKLGMGDQVADPMAEALKRAPESAHTHAVVGWGLLEQGKTKESLTHFREALRLEPNLELARQGMMEALKSQYLFYRLFMKFFFWMSNQGAQVQWIVILGILFGGRLIRSIADENEAIRPFLMVIYGGLVAFALLTWIITPLSDLLLRLNPFGRYLLNKDQTRASTYVGIALAVGLVGLIAYLATGLDIALATALVGVTMMLPLGSMFSRGKGKKRLFLVGYTVVMLIVGLVAVFFTFILNSIDHMLIMAYGILFVAYTWIANFITSR